MRPDVREDIEKQNSRFERYYNDLELFGREEYEQFWVTLRRGLPNSFRFTGSKSQALPVQQLLRDRYIPEITSIEYNGEYVAPPTPVAWYPYQLAWQMTTPKNIVRKFPPFAAFQKFLVSETSVGNISRQEIVSMIPPLLMDIRSSMTVLDMCAAPGSKAAQLTELIHNGEEARMRTVARQSKLENGREPSPESVAIKQEMKEEEQRGEWPDDGRSTGLVIANDIDYRRAHMLTHQMKRLNSPNLIVTSHDATMYPSIKLPSSNGPNKYLKFDRILADVPCSGDGTCRKNLNVWKDWSPGNGLGLHPTQQRILVRALQMLKIGGRVVYSTCSMNPVENEAVIASAIDRCGGLANVGLVDCSGSLPGLRRRNGLHQWKVMDKLGNVWATWKDVEAKSANEGEEGLGKIYKGMFPPTDNSLHLDRCMRVYPQLQDTGAFFIAVLEKKSEIKARPESEPTRPQPEHTSIVNAVNKIERQHPTTGNDPTEKIDALDSIAPPTISQFAEGVTAVARQNKEVAPSTSPSLKKRSLDAQADALVSNKRPKFRDEIDDPAPQGAEDRQVHWPPPPGAVLDASRSEITPSHQVSSPGDGPLNGPHHPTLRHTDARVGKKRNDQPYEEPFKYLQPDHPELQTISSFYALSARFPHDRFMVRNALGTPVKTIYYTSALARDILISNASSGIKFIHCGVKMFVRQDVQSPEVCRWRIQNEGLPLIEAWIGDERAVKLYRRSTLRGLLVEMFPKIEGSGWEKLGEIAERVKDISMGCCVLRVEKSEDEDGFRERMTLPLWRSAFSLNLMLPKEDRSAMLLRLYNETTPMQDHSKERFAKREIRAKDGNDVKREPGAQQEDDVVVGEEEDAELEAKQEILVKAETDEELDSDDDEGGGVPVK